LGLEINLRIAVIKNDYKLLTRKSEGNTSTGTPWPRQKDYMPFTADLEADDWIQLASDRIQ
jgi:hypothetical protein